MILKRINRATKVKEYFCGYIANTVNWKSYAKEAIGISSKSVLDKLINWCKLNEVGYNYYVQN